MTQKTQADTFDAKANKKVAKDTQHRKYHITINNPAEHGFTHAKIAQNLQSLKSLVYYCMANEQGDTFHTHIFVAFSSVVRFSTIKELFPPAHIEPAKGTAQSNREYILKEGKWADTEKCGTSIPGTFEEYGQIPVERQGARTDIELLYLLIKEGKSNAELLEIKPDYMMVLDKIEKTRQTLLYEEVRNEFRKLDVTYIYGSTGVGKTRYVMEKHGYSSVYKVTDYQHPFDGYTSEPVLLLDEFHSGLRINDMLNYLDGYPLTLPARYSNKTACYTSVYIISNLELEEQYPMIQQERPEVWKALLRRIHRVIEFDVDGNHINYTTNGYLNGFRDVSSDPAVNSVFDEMEKADKAPKQLEIKEILV